MPDGLTEKQRRFVEAYTGAAEGNATEAARLAKYNGDERTLAVRGAQLIRSHKVAAAIGEATKEVRNAAVMTRKERQERLTEIARTGADKDAIRAVEVLGKMQGDFIERSEQRVTTNIDPRLAGLTPRQLVDLLDEGEDDAEDA